VVHAIIAWHTNTTVARAALGIQTIGPDTFFLSKRAALIAGDIFMLHIPKDPNRPAMTLSNIRKRIKSRPLLETFGMWLARDNFKNFKAFDYDSGGKLNRTELEGAIRAWLGAESPPLDEVEIERAGTVKENSIKLQRASKTKHMKCSRQWYAIGDKMLEKVKDITVVASSQFGKMDKKSKYLTSSLVESIAHCAQGMSLANRLMIEARKKAEDAGVEVEDVMARHDPTICKKDGGEHAYKFGKCSKCSQGEGVARGWNMKFGECAKGGKHVYKFSLCTKCGEKEGSTMVEKIVTHVNVAKEKEKIERGDLKIKELGVGPRMLFCHLCATSHGLASLRIHQKQCAVKWKHNQQTPVPMAPLLLIPGPDATHDMVEQYNTAAKEVYQASMPSCGRCSRTFDTKRKLEAHAAYCYSQP